MMHIIYVVLYIRSYKNRVVFQRGTKLWKSGSNNCFPVQVVFGEIYPQFLCKLLRIHHPSINALIPTFNLFICHQIQHPCGLREPSGFHPALARAAGGMSSQAGFGELGCGDAALLFRALRFCHQNQKSA